MGLPTIRDEHEVMEAALRAIRDDPGKAANIADTTLALIDATRRIRADMLLSDLPEPGEER
jgi:hypothetical protein